MLPDEEAPGIGRSELESARPLEAELLHLVEAKGRPGGEGSVVGVDGEGPLLLRSPATPRIVEGREAGLVVGLAGPRLSLDRAQGVEPARALPLVAPAVCGPLGELPGLVLVHHCGGDRSPAATGETEQSFGVLGHRL